MKRKLTALLLALTLLAAMTACGNAASSAAESRGSSAAEVSLPAESSTEANVPSEPDAAEASAPAEESSAAEDAASVSEAAEAAPTNETVIEYPLADGETLSIFCAKPGGPPIVRDSWGELEIFQNAEEYLGVSIDWNEVDMMALDTQFNLMVASGDYNDIISGVIASYAGGGTGAYEDGVIVDIAGLTYDNMPNYWNLVHADPEIEKYVTTEEGLELAVCVVNDEPLTEKGLVIRSDWLEEQGLDMPETFEDLETALLSFKDSYGCSNPLYVGETGLGIGGLTSGYDISYYDDGLSLYVDDSRQLVCSYMTDAYRDYLEMMNRWLNEGLFSGDMILNAGSVSMNDTQTYVCGDNVGLFHSSGNQLSTYYTYTENPNFALSPINVIVRNPGDDTINHFGTYEPIQTRQTVSISTACANVELALRWLDYWYSEEGIMSMTYGVEDYTYQVAEDGTVTYTDLVVNNTDGMSPEGMIMKYNCAGKICGVMVQKANWAYYSDYQKDALDFWSSRVAYDRSIPAYVALTTAESSEYNTLIADITAYAESELSKFLFGERPFSEWDDFTASLESMGINDAIAIYQAAFDRQTA